MLLQQKHFGERVFFILIFKQPRETAENFEDAEQSQEKHKQTKTVN